MSSSSKVPMLLSCLPLLLLAPRLLSANNFSSCQAGPWHCVGGYRLANEPLPVRSHCNLSRTVQCNGDKFHEIVSSADQQALLGIECPWIKRDFGISQLSPVYRCSSEPVYNRSMHPAAAWCPWTFWSAWSFVCGDRPAASLRLRREVETSDGAIGAFESTRRRQCRCPNSPGYCSTGKFTEQRWRPADRQQSVESTQCSWCAWGQWTRNCTCSFDFRPRTRYRACACSNGTVLRSRGSGLSDRLSISFESLPCFGMPTSLDTCSICYNRPNKPEYPRDPSSDFRPPPVGSDSSDVSGGRTLVGTLAFLILAIALLIYYAKKCRNGRRTTTNTEEPVAVHLAVSCAAASEPQPPPPLQSQPLLLPPPTQAVENSAPPPSYEEAIGDHL